MRITDSNPSDLNGSETTEWCGALQPPSGSIRYGITRVDRNVKIESDGEVVFEGQLDTESQSSGSETRVRALSAHPSAEVRAVLHDHLFGHAPILRSITLNRLNGESTTENRNEFYQRPFPWHRSGGYRIEAERWSETNGRRHPVRPRLDPGTLYRRYVPEIGKTVSFRTADVERDLRVFHRWHNHPRVYGLWDLNRPIDELKTYLENGLADPHQIPLMCEFDGEPIGYFEIYWAAEDRLAPYYDSEPYDRGFHFLIGNPRALGVANTGAVVRSIMHLLYLEDPRTRRIVAEPRSDNRMVLKYAQLVPGWRIVKEFDFPHKRAALLMANREDFFFGGAL